MTVITKPGAYQMAEEDYHQDPIPGGSLSCSGAKLLLPPSCPAIFAWRRDHPAPPTAAMELGTAAHREVLGTGRDYAVWPGESWSDKGGKAFREQAHADGQVPIKAAQHQQIKEMAAAITAHPSASILLRADEVMNEISLFWRDDLGGYLAEPIWRRSRLDAVKLEGRVYIVDYKSAFSADRAEFARAAARLGYHMQDAFYRQAVTRTLGDADPAFLFVVQDKDPPYLAAVYDLGWRSQATGEALVEQACREYARCVAAGEWPGYQLEDAGDPRRFVETIELPGWALRGSM
jgi:hypothetical protein